MEGKKILEAVSLIQMQKDEKEKAKKEMLNKKHNEKEDFYKCREKCVCDKPSGKCRASNLKECPECHNILRSTCNKAKCKVNGMKPVMIIPACELQKLKVPSRNVRRRLADISEEEISEDEDISEDEQISEEEMEVSSKGKVESGAKDITKTLLTFWKSLN